MRTASRPADVDAWLVQEPTSAAAHDGADRLRKRIAERDAKLKVGLHSTAFACYLMTIRFALCYYGSTCTLISFTTQDEMLGKLKELGNSLLGKFGMSLDNFKAVKDPATGSYSISFQR